jgi:hypothetical protein
LFNHNARQIGSVCGDRLDVCVKTGGELVRAK